MQRWTTETIRSELRHGHSDLILLLDEVDAHLRCLTESPEYPEVILEEFVRYTHRFCAEVAEHIDEEEDDLFPLVHTVVAGSELDELGELRRQHGELLRDLGRLTAALRALAGEIGGHPPESLAKLVELSSLTRRHLVTHSKSERAFLLRIEDRLAEACLRGC